MSHNGRTALERELERETRFLQRQELMKRLWRLNQDRPPPNPATNQKDKPPESSQDR